jgi:hypothetical protein
MTPLLERNEQFAGTYTPAALGIRARQALIATRLDHRVDPRAHRRLSARRAQQFGNCADGSRSPSWQAVAAGNRFVQYFLLTTGAG